MARKRHEEKNHVLSFALRHALCSLPSPRRSSEKSSASVSWIIALLPVARPPGGVPARAAQAWLDRGKEYHHRVPICRGKAERLPELAAELVRLKVDLIVATGTSPALAAKKRYYYHPHPDDKRGGPRGCRFGCQSGAAGRQCHRFLEFIAELNSKRLEILKDAVPKLARVGLLRSPAGIEETSN